MVLEDTRVPLEQAEVLLTELAALVAESDLLYDDEYDPSYDADPTDGEVALDYGDSNEDLNNLAAAAYAMQAGMPVTRWRLARKNTRERERAKRAARQFHAYAMAQWALMVAGKIDVATMNARVLRSFQRQARNAFIAGRRAMGMMQAISPEDEAVLQEMLSIDEGSLSALNSENSAEHMGLVGKANEYYNQYTNVQMVKDWTEKALKKDPTEDVEMGDRLKDLAKDLGPKIVAAGTGVGAAEKFDESLGYKEGWNSLSEKFDVFGRRIENAVSTGEMNALGGLPGEAILVWWELGEADHCDDCIALSDASPLYLSALDENGIFPGSGHTQCGGNCHCSLQYETPDQVCADGMTADAGDPDLAVTEAGVYARVNVWVQEAESCDNPVDVSSMDIGDQDALDEEDAYNWDEDVQSTFEGEVEDSVPLADILSSAEPAAIDLQRLFGFFDRIIGPDIMDVARVGDLHDEVTDFKYVWHETADAVVLHAGVIAKGPPALEHEFTLRAMSQLSQRAAQTGKALVIDGKAASPGLAKWLDTLGAEHRTIGGGPAKVIPHFPTAYVPPRDLFVPGRVTIGVSRMRPELGEAKTLSEVEALRNTTAIHDAEMATMPDLKKLHVAVEGQTPVIGRYTFGDISGGEPSLQVELNAHKVSLQDIDLANAYLVRRNLQDSTITTIVGDDMKRLGLAPNGYLLRITGLPVKKMEDVYAAVGSLVPVASIDAIHGIVEFSVFEKDVTPELKAGFQKITETFPGAKLAIQDAHIRWYFQDAETRTATDFIHGPVEDLLTADDVTAAYPTDLRVNAIGEPRGSLAKVASGVTGTPLAAVSGYGLGTPEEDLARLLERPLPTEFHFINPEVDAEVKAAEKASAKWAADRTAEQKGAFLFYQSTGHKPINDWLRAGQPGGEKSLQAALAKSTGGIAYTDVVDALDSALDASNASNAQLVLSKDEFLYRGVGGAWKTPRVGDILQDKGYVSTTLDPHVAFTFAGEGAPVTGKFNPIMYRYAVPKGYRAAYLDAYFDTTVAPEREVLLRRDEKFRVVGVHEDVTMGMHKVTFVDLVPDESIQYRKSEDWLKTVRPHFVPPQPKDLSLDPHMKLGGLTQKAIFVDPKGDRWLFKPKKIFIDDVGLSRDAANVEKTADYVYDALGVKVKPVEPFTVDFPRSAKQTITRLNTEGAEKSLTKFRDQFAEPFRTVPGEAAKVPTKEIAYGWNADGTVRWSRVGSEDTIDLASLGPKGLDGAIVDHLHPDEEGFSPDDLKTAVNGKVAEMRVETPNHSLVIRPGPGGWGVTDIDAAITEYDARVNALLAGPSTLTAWEATTQALGETAAKYGWRVDEADHGVAGVVDIVSTPVFTETGGNIQRLVDDVIPITAGAPDGASPDEVVDALTPKQTTQLAQHQIADWMFGNDDGHIGQWLLDKNGDMIGIDKDAAIWELGSQKAVGAVTMDQGQSFARAIFDHPTTGRLARLDPKGIADVLNRADAITDVDYIEQMRPIVATLMAHPNAVKLDEQGWINLILKRKHELRHDVDLYYQTKIAEVKAAGIDLPDSWRVWDKAGGHFPASTDVKSALHYEAEGPPIEMPKPGREGNGFRPLDPQMYDVPGSPIPLNGPLPAWSGRGVEEPPLPKLKATKEELAAARDAAHSVTRTIDGVLKGDYRIGISFTPADSIAAENAGLAYAKLGGVRIYAKTEADLAPLKDYLAVKGHSSFDQAFENLIGYSDEDISILDAYDHAKTGYSLRAGAIVVEPDGRMWVLAPNNKFAGYSNTWPKGGVDGTETAAAAAVRELREETGIGIELDGYLGDYVNTDKTAVSRMYIAHRVGGGPLYAAPKETYKVRLMTPAQAQRNLLRYGKPDARDQAILKDVQAALSAHPGDLQYVVPAADATDFHNAIATVRTTGVPDGKPHNWPVIDFSPNPTSLKPINPSTAFSFDPAKVASLMGKEVDIPPDTKVITTKSPRLAAPQIKYTTTVWPLAPNVKAEMLWRQKGFGLEWVPSKKVVDEPNLRTAAHVAQLRKFGEMFEANGTLAHLQIDNEVLNQVPHVKEMIASVGGYNGAQKFSTLDRAQVAKLLAITKGAPVTVATEVAVPTAAIDPVKKVVGRSKVSLDAVATALGSPAVASFEPPAQTSLLALKAITDIKARKATFKALSETERSALADAAVTVPARIEQLTAALGPRDAAHDPLQSINLRMSKAIDAGVATPKQAMDARSWTYSVRDQLYQAGLTDEGLLRDVLLDTYDAMLAQENETVGQVLGDHGIRHIIGNAQRAIQTLEVVPGHDTASDRAMMSVAAALHDIGYLTPTGRMFLTADHPAWSMDAFNARYRPNLEKAFGKEWTDELAHIIDTHDTSELDWVNEPRASAFRLADNLALFEADKLPALIAYVPENKKVLIDYAEGKIDLGTAKGRLLGNIYDNFPGLALTPIKKQLLAAVDEVGPTLPKFTIGMFGAKIGDIKWTGDHVAVDLIRGPENEALSKVIDGGQEQFAKFANTYGHDGKAFVEDGTFAFKEGDKVELTATISTPGGVKVDAADIAVLTTPDAETIADELLVVSTGPPPYDTQPGAIFTWMQEKHTVAPKTWVFRYGPGNTTVGVQAAIDMLDTASQQSVIAATLAKIDLTGITSVRIHAESLSAKTTEWLTDTLGMTTAHFIPVANLQKWQDGLLADFVDHDLDTTLLAKTEAMEPETQLAAGGALTQKYGIDVAKVNAFAIEDKGPYPNIPAHMLTVMSAADSPNIFVETSKSGDVVLWHTLDGGGVSQAFRRPAAIRYLRSLGDEFAADPSLQVLVIAKDVVKQAGADFRDLVSEFTNQVGKNPVDFGLPRSTVLAIKDTLDKETLDHIVAPPIPEAGIKAFIPLPAGETFISPTGKQWTMTRGDWESTWVPNVKGQLVYGGGVSQATGLQSASDQIADIIAAKDIGTADTFVLSHLTPEAHDALMARGATETSYGSVSITRAQINALAAEYAKPAGSTVGVAGDWITKIVKDTGALNLEPLSSELLPEYKAYAKGEIQLRKTVYGSKHPSLNYGSVVWRRWGNRIEAWEIKDAQAPGQIAFLAHVAKTMEEYPKVAYLRIMTPDTLDKDVRDGLMKAGAKLYSGGLRIEQKNLIAFRDSLKTVAPAAVAEVPKEKAISPIFDKYGLGMHAGPLDEKIAEAVNATNSLAFSVTEPDKYKFSWASYTSADGLSAQIVTRTSKTELWWRRVLPGAASSGINTERAVLREWVRQGDAFDANPGWTRMRITGLKGLSKDFLQLLQDRGAETIDADTLHLSREKVLQLRDDISAALGQKTMVEASTSLVQPGHIMGDLLGTGPGEWFNVQMNLTGMPATSIGKGYIAKFEHTPFEVFYDKADNGDVLVKGLSNTAVPQAEKGSAFGAFLMQAANNATNPVRLRQYVTMEFPELRDALLDAGAHWDDGELVLDLPLLTSLKAALEDDIPLPKAQELPKVADVKLSAQLGIKHSWVTNATAKWDHDALDITPIDSSVPHHYTYDLGLNNESITLHTPTIDLSSDLAAIKAVMENVELPGNEWLGGALGLIKFPTAEWSYKMQDVLKASGGVVDTSGNIRMTVGNLSKLAAKITDDIGIDSPLLGSAASETPLKVWPDIAAQIKASIPTAVPAESYLGIPIVANTLTSGLANTTTFPEAVYDWVKGSSTITVTTYHTTGGKYFAGPAGMVALMRHFGDLAAADPEIKTLTVSSKELGSLQTDWLKAWGAKESITTNTIDGSVTGKALTLDREQLLTLHDQIEKQFLGGNIPTVALTPPGIGSIIHTLGTTEEAVSKAGGTWTDAITDAGVAVVAHKATLGGADVVWAYDFPGKRVIWQGMNVINTADVGAAKIAALRVLLTKADDLDANFVTASKDMLHLDKDLRQLLIDHGAIVDPNYDILTLEPDKVKSLVAELGKITSAGVVVEPIEQHSLASIAQEALEGDGMNIFGNNVKYDFASGNTNVIIYKSKGEGQSEADLAKGLFANINSDVVNGQSFDIAVSKELAVTSGTENFLLRAGGVEKEMASTYEGTTAPVILFKGGEAKQNVKSALDMLAAGKPIPALPDVPEAVGAATHISIGGKFGFNGEEATKYNPSTVTGGVQKKKVLWKDVNGGYYSTDKLAAEWVELKTMLRWDKAAYGTYSTMPETEVKDLLAYRQVQLLASRAAASGRGIAIVDPILTDQPKIASLLKGYGATSKKLGTVGSGLLLTPEQVSKMDAAFQREKSAAIFAAKPTGTGVLVHDSFGGNFNYNAQSVAKVTGGETIELDAAGKELWKVAGDGWMLTSVEVPSTWDENTKYPVSALWRRAPDIYGGTGLTLAKVTGYNSTNVFYERLKTLLNDPEHPIDILRVRPGSGVSVSLMQSLGVKQDVITKEFVLNPEQTKLLGDSLKQNKVLWDEKAFPVSTEAPHVETPITPPPAPVAAPVAPPVIPTPPPVAPVAAPTTLSAAYGYSHSVVLALTGNTDKLFESTIVSVGKHGPSLRDVWTTAEGKTEIRWAYDDHKGTKIAHIRAVTGPADSGPTRLLAELSHQISGYMANPQSYAPLSRVIIDKKALAGMPKIEQMLKDAGWKETKAYYTTDKAGLTALVAHVKGDTAPSWMASIAIPTTVPATPVGAGAGIEATLAMPGKVGKVASPSFIYGFDKAGVDTAYGGLVQNDIGVLSTKGGDAQTYELVSGPTTGKWSVSPSGKTVGWFEFNGTGDPVADASSGFAMLRKIAEDAQNRTTDFWVKPEVYDKIVGLRQMLKDAGGIETEYANLGTAIKMPAKDAVKFVQSLSTDTMSGLKVSIEHPADYLVFDHAKALELFESEPIVKQATTAGGAIPFTEVTFPIYKVGDAKALYTTKDRVVTWKAISGVPSTSTALATVATLQWFNEQGIVNLIVTEKVLTGTPKLAQFLVASGGKVIGKTVSLDATALNNVAKFLNKEKLPELLGGAKLPYSIADEMAAKSTTVIAALHSEQIATDGLTRRSYFSFGSASIETDWTRSKDNIYWRGLTTTVGSVGDERAVVVAQLHSLLTDVAENANIQRLDVDERLIRNTPQLREILAKFGATSHSEGSATYWSLDRGRAEKMWIALSKDLGDTLVAPVGYAADQARLIVWPAAEKLTLADPKAAAALGGQTRKAIFKDAEGNEWLFKPGASGRGAVTDQAVSELALRLGLPVPTAHVYTLNIARPGEPENLVQGSLYKMIPKVKPVDLATLNPAQVQDVMRQSILDWVVANDDAHAGNYLINAADDHVWAIDKSRAWVEFHQAHDVLNRNSEGNLGGTPLLFKFFRQAVADPEKLRLIHPTTIAITLRHLQEIFDDEFKRIVEPVARAATSNPRYKGNPEKFLAEMLDRKHGAASDFEAFFRTQIKDAMATSEASVPEEWKSWLAKGGEFDLTATPEDLWKERMADLDSKFGTYSRDAITQKLEQNVFSPIRSEIRDYFSGGASGHKSGKYGSELIRPRLDRKGMADALKEWQDLNQWGILHIVNGEPGPQSARMDENLRKFWNKETGSFRITHSTNRYGRNPDAYVNGMNQEGIRNLIGTAIGTHVVVAGSGGVYYYIDLPYDQVFSSMALGYGHGEFESEILAADVRPEQIVAIRPQANPMDLTKLMDYNGPVISKAA